MGKEEETKEQGFSRVSSIKRGGPKHDNQEVNKKIVVSNKFDVLDDGMEENLDKQSAGK